MLIKRHSVLETDQTVKIEKRVDGEDASLLGAFALGEEVSFSVRLPRRLGVSAVVMRISPDGGEALDLPFLFSASERSVDLYTLTLSTKELCGEAEDGLFFYELLFLRGFDTLFSDSINNVDFRLSEHSGNKFRLLVHSADFRTPAWFHGGIMYHVFLDRFCRGRGEVSLRDDAVLNEDWEKGIPQFAKKAGEPLSNNVFFGGNLWGVAEKLDYLKTLGVTVLYLSPLFESASNHRYDTADYEKIDALLGGEAAFANLIKEAHARGMKVILDGVFNHTGDDSKYFNRRGHYETLGAYQSKKSPYATWFTFRKFPDDYEAWWGIEIMPRLNHASKDCRRYFTGKDGIAAKMLRAGADGWRLDVADELCNAFLNELNETVKSESGGEAILIGEVWENAVDKISYGERKRYFRGHQLDSVMNYPFRNAVMAFLQNGDAETFVNTLTELYATYPPTVSHALMNLLGTHDTERILTHLGDKTAGEGKENPELAKLRLSPKARKEAIAKLKIASALQYTVYGIPSLYYGDEAGVEGYHDPFCRMPFPWGREDRTLLAHYRALGRMRHQHPALKDGSFAFLAHTASAFAFERKDAASGDALIVAANAGDVDFELPLHGAYRNALTQAPVCRSFTVKPNDCVILERI
ncbi:MAG: glycoside hydrolase family 13 protein [Clostridia bacterium]|nr:glycoside hydrolase family 13 protein [Clostridia bacterium]